MKKLEKVVFKKSDEKIHDMNIFKVQKGDTEKLALVATIKKDCRRIHGILIPSHNVEISYLNHDHELLETEIIYYQPEPSAEVQLFVS